MGEAPGRPRLQQTDEAILNAVVECLIEGGIEGTSIERVAKRSGVGRPTVYRRYENKYEMVEACIANLFEREIPEPQPSNDPKVNIENHLKSTVGMLTDTPIGPIFHAVLSDVPRHPQIAKLVNKFGQSRRRRFVALLDTAINTGDIQLDQSPDMFADALLGAVYFRFMMGRSVTKTYALDMFNALIHRASET